MSDIPEEVVAELLSRLPPETLLKFRCVSKSWRALIDSPEFIKTHLNRTRKFKTHRKLFIRHSHIGYLDIDSLDVPSNPDSVFSAKYLKHPLDTEESGNGTRIMGSCDGLLCLQNHEGDLVLWNPSTRKFKSLPIAGNRYFLGQILVNGFGYDSVSDDYKVTNMAEYCTEGYQSVSSEVVVYSLKTNSWRRIADFPYVLQLKKAWGVLAGGALHWIVSRNPGPELENLIAAFDLGTEEYRLVPKPNCSKATFFVTLEALDDCLTLCNFYWSHIDLWVMKEYGVKESWIKFFQIAQPNNFDDYGYLKPIAYSQDGERLLLDKCASYFMWYDLKDKSFKKLVVEHVPYDFEAWTSFGSLVKLGDGRDESSGNEKRREEKEKQNKGIKKRDEFLSKGFKLVL